MYNLSQSRLLDKGDRSPLSAECFKLKGMCLGDKIVGRMSLIEIVCLLFCEIFICTIFCPTMHIYDIYNCIKLI